MKKNLAKLVKKVITDKRGKKTTVWVRMEKPESKSKKKESSKTKDLNNKPTKLGLSEMLERYGIKHHNKPYPDNKAIEEAYLSAFHEEHNVAKMTNEEISDAWGLAFGENILADNTGFIRNFKAKKPIKNSNI